MKKLKPTLALESDNLVFLDNQVMDRSRSAAGLAFMYSPSKSKII